MRPITDRVFEAVAGEIVSDVEVGEITWSNELTAHVIELKTTEPAALARRRCPHCFRESVRRINSDPRSARVAASCRRPCIRGWIRNREMVMWPHDYSVVYEAFNRIFDCRGHGWANLQAVHLEPAVCRRCRVRPAACGDPRPAADLAGAGGQLADHRWAGCRACWTRGWTSIAHNCRRIPLATGRVIPEPVFSAADYRSHILEPL